MRRFWKISNFEALNFAIQTLKEWEYPREITQSEEWGVWYGYGEDCLFWIEEVDMEPCTGIFHIAVDPKTQKRHGAAARELFKHLKVFSDLEGYDRLIANDCTESGEVTDYLKRLGWTPCVMDTIEGEWFEKRFVDGDEDSHVKAPATEDRPSI